MGGTALTLAKEQDLGIALASGVILRRLSPALINAPPNVSGISSPGLTSLTSRTHTFGG
jgi:hypothetical protein